MTKYGETIDASINSIKLYYKNIVVDKYIIMPNHVHLLILIQDDDCGRIISSPTISVIIGQMKRWVSKQVGESIWQRSFHDHIIRDEHDYEAICQYIDENPLKWAEDRYYR